jgi:broad-specificity NMP kinase
MATASIIAAAARGARSMATAAGPARKLVFFGAPGVGKGTFAGRIAPELGIPAISTGDIIRAEIKAGTDIGKQVKVSERDRVSSRARCQRLRFSLLSDTNVATNAIGMLPRVVCLFLRRQSLKTGRLPRTRWSMPWLNAD